MTDSYCSCISLCGGANGIIYLVKLGDYLIVNLENYLAFCVSILGHGRHHPLMLPKELYAVSEKVSKMTLRRKKDGMKVI